MAWIVRLLALGAGVEEAGRAGPTGKGCRRTDVETRDVVELSSCRPRELTYLHAVDTVRGELG